MTNWALVREVLNSVVDACQLTEELGIRESDGCVTIARPDGSLISVADLLISSWTYPENVGYEIIAWRAKCGASAAYVPPLARSLANVAKACTEGIGVSTPDVQAHIDTSLQRLGAWYRNNFAPMLRDAIAKTRRDSVVVRTDDV